MTPTAGPRARRGHGQGVGFRPYVYRLARDERLGGWVRNDERGVVLEVEGAPDAVERFLARLPREAPPLAAVERVRSSRASACRGERDFAIVESAGRGRGRRAGRARLGDLRRLPRRAARPGRPAPPLPVHQLHRLRPALHDRPRRPVRPRAHDDGRLRDVRGVPRGVRGPARPPLPRRAERVPGLRPARAAACDATRAPTCRPDRAADAGDAVGAPRRALRGGAIVAVKGLGGYHLACRADDAAQSPRCAPASTARSRPFALMAAGLDGGARARRARRRGRGARWPARDRPIVIAPRAPGARGGRGRRAGPARARRDAAVLAAAPPAARGRRRAARDDERQRVRRADRVRRRRRARAAGAASPTLSSSTTARSRRAPTTRSSAARSCCAARAGWCRRASRCPCRGAPGARVRRRAQEHVLPREGRPRVGRATTSAT